MIKYNRKLVKLVIDLAERQSGPSSSTIADVSKVVNKYEETYRKFLLERFPENEDKVRRLEDILRHYLKSRDIDKAILQDVIAQAKRKDSHLLQQRLEIERRRKQYRS